MFKKLFLTVCLTAFLAWAQDDEDDDEWVEAPAAAASKSADAEDDDEDSAPSSKAAAGEEDDEFDDGLTAAQRNERISRKKFEEEQRLDEYANSERRRDWLRNRFMLQIGMGSRYPIMGETGMGMGFGAGIEYILPFHLSLFGSYGFLPTGTDNDFDDIDLEGGTGWKAGINYYLFPKNPLHLGISVSYGTVYFDHAVEPKGNERPIIIVDGWQFDALISYLTNEWYYLQFSFGMYYAPDLAKSGKDNPSMRENIQDRGTYESAVVNKDGMSKTGIVFGIAIGYALPELFPDDTEKRRREREKLRKKEGR